jgi:NAD(P)-dependent dehydrogenase (short-subunit alcohol dehydrogenase family)
MRRCFFAAQTPLLTINLIFTRTLFRGIKSTAHCNRADCAPVVKIMKIKDKIILVTGGANGIGRGLCERFAAEGAGRIYVADINFEKAEKVAAKIGGKSFRLDVADEANCGSVVETILNESGRIDLVASNAGIGGDEGCLEVSNESWQNIWEINVLSHLYLSRAVFPSMLERGEGYFLITASAAGLLTLPIAAPYAVTKHAAVAFAEYLAFAYLDKGIKVSCLCPQGVKTDLIATPEGEPESFLMPEAITVEDCAEAVVKGLESENFLILPHPQVAEFVVKKVSNYDKWLSWMSGLRAKILSETGK